MKRVINASDPIWDSLFSGAVSLEKSERWIQPWRLPVADRDLFTAPDGILIDRARSASGVRLDFSTDSRFLRLNFEVLFSDADDPLDFALVRNNCIVEIVRGRKEDGCADFAFSDPGSYEIWLHPYYGFRITSLEIEGNAVISGSADRRAKWVSYGSSITMGRQAVNGASTWPATAARKMDLNLVGLGFAGQCHIDPLISDVIIEQNPQIVTLKLGINVYGGNSLNFRTFRIAVMGLVQRLRRFREDLPIGIVSPIFCADREDTPNKVGMTLKDYRSEVEAAFHTFKMRGDEYLTYTHGYELLGPDEAHMMPDGLHPGPSGYRMMGERAADIILPRLLEMAEMPAFGTIASE